MAKNDELMCLR